jgi:hypothetical protein
MLDIVLSALVAVACGATGACPVKPSLPVPLDISPDPIPTKKPPAQGQG